MEPYRQPHPLVQINNNLNNEALPGGPLRELKGRLVEFHTRLQSYPHPSHDLLTPELIRWCSDFKGALRNHHLERIQEEYIDRLQNLLLDPCRRIPIDEEAYLGSDGYTYDKKALLLYLHHAQGVYRHRSPCYPERELPFTVAKHPMVPMLVQWLKEKGAWHLSTSVEEEYQSLQRQGALPFLPTEANERIRLQRERIAKQNLEYQREEELTEQLGEFAALFYDSPLSDPLTANLQEWQQLFSRAIDDSEEIEATEKEFIELLQSHLRDAITLSPLDEKPLLGSDGFTYSTSSLLLYIAAAPLPYSRRSPREPENPDPFTVVEHPIASAMIQWLREKEAYTPPLELLDLYQELAERGEAPLLPTEENILAAEARAAALQRARNQGAALQEFHQRQLERQIQGEIAAAFAPIHEQIAADGRDLRGRVAEIGRLDEQQQRILIDRINLLDDEQQDIKEPIGRLLQNIDSVDQKIAAAHRYNAELQVQIEQTRQAIKEREKAGLNSLLTSLAIVAACLVGQQLLPLILKGVSVTTLPQAGGAMLKATIPLTI